MVSQERMHISRQESIPYKILYRLTASREQGIVSQPPNPPSVLLHPDHDPSQDNPGLRDAGGCILLTNLEQITFKLGLGIATDNKTELLAASTLLDSEWENGIQDLNLYGDSKIIVGWLNGSLHTSSIHPRVSIRDIRENIQLFISFSITHIFRELKTLLRKLSFWTLEHSG